MNRQIGIVIVMVSAMMYFMVSIVRHFMDDTQAQKAAVRDSVIQSQIQQLQDDNAVLREAIRSHEVRLDNLKSKIDHVNYKVNLVVN